MGLAADECYLQLRMLNTSRVRHCRPCGRRSTSRFSARMRRALELQEGWAATDLCRRPDGKDAALGVITEQGEISARAVIIATGTTLGKVFIGDWQAESDRTGGSLHWAGAGASPAATACAGSRPEPPPGWTVAPSTTTP